MSLACANRIRFSARSIDYIILPKVPTTDSSSIVFFTLPYHFLAFPITSTLLYFTLDNIK